MGSEDFGYGLDLAGGLGSGIYTGATAAPFLANTLGMGGAGTALGWGLGGALAAGSMYLTWRNREEAKKAYRAKREEIEAFHKGNVAKMARGHELRAKAIEYGRKGAGGGHTVGVDREGTQQKHARTQQAEIKGLEQDAEQKSYLAQMAANRARKYQGGSGQAVALAQFLGEIFKEFSEEPKGTKKEDMAFGGGSYWTEPATRYG